MKRPWTERLAALAVDALRTAKIVNEVDVDRAIGIVEEEIRVRLALGDLPEFPDGTMAQKVLSGDIEAVAEQAESILKAVAPAAYCAAQEWDSRIDCLIKLPDGSGIGEMVSLNKATEERIRRAGARLQMRLHGMPVPLENELLPPIKIFEPSPRENSN